MTSARRRLSDLEAKIGARASPTAGRPPWRTPEQEAAREEGFRQLYEQMGWPWPPDPTKDRKEALEELFREIDEIRENERKEQH